MDDMFLHYMHVDAGDMSALASLMTELAGRMRVVRPLVREEADIPTGAKIERP